jgi:hypothetical protein
VTPELRWESPQNLLRFSSVNVGKRANPANVDFLFALAGLDDIVRGLHPHERVHLHSECLFNAQGHVPGKICLAVEQAGQGRPGHLERGCRCRYREARGLDNLGPDEISGVGRVLHGMWFDHLTSNSISFRQP